MIRFPRENLVVYLGCEDHKLTQDNDFTELLKQAGPSGEGPSATALLPLVYSQLRAVAQKHLSGERPDHTLQATALVHEAYLKLAGPREIPWQNRAHYFVAAADAMRLILLEHARAKAAAKRGGPDARRAAIELSSLPDANSERESAGFLILDQAISHLEKENPRAARVVRLRYFAGLSVQETAKALGLSEPTVKRTWAFARGWLKVAIESERV